jgi:hypothetical protein
MRASIVTTLELCFSFWRFVVVVCYVRSILTKHTQKLLGTSASNSKREDFSQNPHTIMWFVWYNNNWIELNWIELNWIELENLLQHITYTSLLTIFITLKTTAIFAVKWFLNGFFLLFLKAPPLIITEEQLNECMGIMEAVFKEIKNTKDTSKKTIGHHDD